MFTCFLIFLTFGSNRITRIEPGEALVTEAATAMEGASAATGDEARAFRDKKWELELIVMDVRDKRDQLVAVINDIFTQVCLLRAISTLVMLNPT